MARSQRTPGTRNRNPTRNCACWPSELKAKARQRTLTSVEKGLGCVRPNEAIDFESASPLTPDITLHRTSGRAGPTRTSSLLVVQSRTTLPNPRIAMCLTLQPPRRMILRHCTDISYVTRSAIAGVACFMQFPEIARSPA